MMRIDRLVVYFLSALFCAGTTAQSIQVNRYESEVIAAKPYQTNPLCSVVSVRFNNKVKLVGDAVRLLLSTTGYKLSPYLTDAALLTLNKPLPDANRALGPISIKDALVVLMGADVFYLKRDPLHRLVSFVVKRELLQQKNRKKSNNDIKRYLATSNEKHSDSPLVISNVISPVSHYLLHSKYIVRVSPFLVLAGLKEKSTQKEILAFGKTHHVFFGFNDVDGIVGVAKSQIIANALAKNPREVFFALTGQSLKETINRWAALNGVRLFWNTDKDLKLSASSAYMGRFDRTDGSLVKLLRSAKRSGVLLKAELEPNHVLIISDKTYRSLFLSPEQGGVR